MLCFKRKEASSSAEKPIRTDVRLSGGFLTGVHNHTMSATYILRIVRLPIQGMTANAPSILALKYDVPDDGNDGDDEKICPHDCVTTSR